MFDKKKFFILLILVISVMASGCFRISSDTAIHKDGSVDIKKHDGRRTSSCRADPRSA